MVLLIRVYKGILNINFEDYNYYKISKIISSSVLAIDKNVATH